jgi:hypothetical protein
VGASIIDWQYEEKEYKSVIRNNNRRCMFRVGLILYLQISE